MAVGGIITTGTHPRALWPGVKAWWGRSYNEHEVEWKHLMEEDTSKMNYELDVKITPFGVAGVKNQGAPIQYDSEVQGFESRYQHITYALGYIVTMEELQDNLYEKVSKTRAPSLAFSHRQTEEIVAANIYNRAFDSGYVGGDGVSLLNASHPNVTGGTFSNILSVPADLSETALEDLIIQMSLATDDRGNRIKVLPKCLLVAPSNWFEANRILQSVFQSNSAENNINVLKATNAIPEGIHQNHYFDAPNAWFIRTNVMNGLKRYTRMKTTFETDNDFDTENAKAKSVQRFSVGWTDPLGLFGSAGL
jgi:hypothetical protein